MSKKALLKIIGCVLVCMCFALISNHIPQLLPRVYEAFFYEFNHVALFFVLGLFVIEVFALRRWGADKRCRYFFFGMAVIASFLVLFKGNVNFKSRLAPGANTTLIYSASTDQNVEEQGRRNVFAEYYFDGKNLIVSGQEKDIEEHQYIYTMAVPSRRVVVGSESVISEEEAGVILSYPYQEYGSDYFVLDEFWKQTDNIRMSAWGDGYIFCSEELLDTVRNQPAGTAPSGEGVDLFAYAEKGSFREVKQTFIILLLMIIGAVAVLPVWGRDYPYLALFLSLPVGAAVWCIVCVIFMILNIPYNIITVSICTVIGVGIRLYRQWNKFKELDGTVCFHFALSAVVVTAFFACFKVCNMSADTITRCMYAYRMAIYGSFREVLEGIAPFGMLEPMIMSMGYLFKCDAVYVFYPLMSICGMGIMCTGLYYINGRKDDYMSIIVLGAGILLLMTNYDYVLNCFLMSPHVSTAVYFLIIFMFLVMKRQINIEKYEWIVVLAAAVSLMTRIEGAVYVMFFLAMSLGLENEVLKIDKVILAVVGTTVVWNVFQMIVIGRDGNPMYWTPERGAVLVAGSLLVAALSWFIRKPWTWLAYVKKHYFLFFVCGICLVTVFAAVFVKREIGTHNFQIYLSHFSNNERMNGINAGAIWTFILLLCPVVIRNGNQVARYTASIIVGYIVLIYFICLFREGSLLHYGWNDSARRTLVHIMPAAVWLLAYNAGTEITEH